jgi:hypothetical protein
MRCSAHCPPATSGLLVPAAVAAGSAGLAGALAVISDLVLAAGITVTLLAVAGIAGLVYVLRKQAEPLYRPEAPAAIPAAQSPRLTAGTPRAISTGRRDAAVTGLVISRKHER